jgi:hypothetical protein
MSIHKSRKKKKEKKVFSNWVKGCQGRFTMENKLKKSTPSYDAFENKRRKFKIKKILYWTIYIYIYSIRHRLCFFHMSWMHDSFSLVFVLLNRYHKSQSILDSFVFLLGQLKKFWNKNKIILWFLTMWNSEWYPVKLILPAFFCFENLSRVEGSRDDHALFGTSILVLVPLYEAFIENIYRVIFLIWSIFYYFVVFFALDPLLGG